MKNSFHSIRAFTLIELLVVISIIAVLSLVVFASFEETRQKSRDTARSSDIQQLAAALQVYAVANGAYPSSLDDLVTADLMGSIPEDPINEGSNVYTYENSCATPSVSSNTQYYRLYTIGEREQGATTAGWSDSKTIGATNCTDPE